MAPILSSNTAPIPTGPRQLAVALNIGFTYTPGKSLTSNHQGALQPFIANADGSNPILLGPATPIASDVVPPVTPANPNPVADPAAVALWSGIAALVQAYAQAKGL